MPEEGYISEDDWGACDMTCINCGCDYLSTDEVQSRYHGAACARVDPNWHGAVAHRLRSGQPEGGVWLSELERWALIAAVEMVVDDGEPEDAMILGPVLARLRAALNREGPQKGDEG